MSSLNECVRVLSRHHQSGPVEADAYPLPDRCSGGDSGRHAAGCLPHGHSADPSTQVVHGSFGFLGRILVEEHKDTFCVTYFQLCSTGGASVRAVDPLHGEKRPHRAAQGDQSERFGEGVSALPGNCLI